MVELDKEEKARILANFEKEAAALSEAQENERKTQKSKLRNRLEDKKRKAKEAKGAAAASPADSAASSKQPSQAPPHEVWISPLAIESLFYVMLLDSLK